MQYDRGADIEAKPFSIGFRIEHPQSIIDKARYGKTIPETRCGGVSAGASRRERALGLQLLHVSGGTVVAATSEEGRVATNGMSQYSRKERNANAGLVVGITPQDYPEHVLAGIDLQRKWESKAFEAGGRTYKAPGQRVVISLRVGLRPNWARDAIISARRAL